jgi:hypothetical protein
MRHLAFALLVATALGASACSAGDDAFDEETGREDEALAPLDAKHLDVVLDRTVIARMYQQDQWTVPGHDAAYVAEQLEAVKPTFVSGLVRLGAGKRLADYPQIVKAWKNVRQKLPRTRFDFVLNICDFTTPEAVTGQMGEINATLGKSKPDIWFFDFYDRPIAPEGDRPCAATKEVLDAAIAFAHAAPQKQLVGGNVWTDRIPDHTDLVAVPDERGLDATMRVVGNLQRSHPAVPRMVHIENNPQKCATCGNDGATFMTGSEGNREKYLTSFASAQRTKHFQYMFPVFFPLSAPGANQHAFDAKAHGTLPFLDKLMRSY